MIDITTATVQEVVKDAIDITKRVASNQTISEDNLREIVSWLCAYTIRLSKDLKGIQCDSYEDVQKEIAGWAKIMKQRSEGDS